MRTSIRPYDIPSPAVTLRCGNALLRLCSPKFHGAGSTCEPSRDEYVLDGKELILTQEEDDERLKVWQILLSIPIWLLLSLPVCIIAPSLLWANTTDYPYLTESSFVLPDLSDDECHRLEVHYHPAQWSKGDPFPTLPRMQVFLDEIELSPARPSVYTVNTREIRREFRTAVQLWASLALLIVGFAVLMLVNGIVNANLPLTVFSVIMAVVFTGLLCGAILYRYAMYRRCLNACRERLRQNSNIE